MENSKLTNIMKVNTINEPKVSEHKTCKMSIPNIKKVQIYLTTFCQVKINKHLKSQNVLAKELVHMPV